MENSEEESFGQQNCRRINLNPELLDEIPKDTFFHMTDLSEKLLKEGRKVGMYPISEESFLDMGEFEEMHRMEGKWNLKAE